MRNFTNEVKDSEFSQKCGMRGDKRAGRRKGTTSKTKA
jgi:hypothetical protein